MQDRWTRMLGGALCGAACGAALTLSLTAAQAQTPPAPAKAPAAQSPTVKAVPGKPVLLIGGYDLSALGYQASEYFVNGTATSYRLPGAATGDGQWDVTPAAKADYATRIVVILPTDAAKFNGTVLVEWLNVTGGQDTPADWMVAHREIVRKGYGYVAVSAQKVGVEGGDTPMQAGGKPLKVSSPERYGSLSHPGDAFSYDIFSQAGALLKAPGASGLLGSLMPRRVVALGESQSAAFLTTYVNAVDPLAKVYDGFLVHSRFGSSAAVDGSRMIEGPGAMPKHVRFRRDLRVPVLTVITETDLLGARLSGYHASRQPDTDRLRVWEIAGAAHADGYLFGGSFIDSGLRSNAELARIFVPSTRSMAGAMDKPYNPGMTQHYVVQAALAGLDGWLRSGKAPASTPRLELATGGTEGVAPTLAVDANGLAKGGIRTPWVDVPTMRMTGYGNSGSFVAMLAGVGEAFDAAKLAQLYPQGKADYVGRFDKALDAAIRAGHILPEDRAEIAEIAAINFGAQPQSGPAATPAAH
ncbi:hypothetical protein LWE61_08920 [Sphingobium sufflavum]|uniref:alpha/beta hydrolase domain-containing protein n=1 Tax=Sphingobium sufflavum TaxID=1129547 RepID=UPI001F2FBB8C|nr:alpha/beta hydrolase domain-containing protein [Sphingobium sufflavum]MCE7796681.1 hypothetical protein [Sphingobium sufflavum]